MNTSCDCSNKNCRRQFVTSIASDSDQAMTKVEQLDSQDIVTKNRVNISTEAFAEKDKSNRMTSPIPLENETKNETFAN